MTTDGAANTTRMYAYFFSIAGSLGLCHWGDEGQKEKDDRTLHGAGGSFGDLCSNTDDTK